MKRAGKGKIQAEELRGQLGDAPGFGEMQGIFAEAYQRSIGRTGDQIKQGQKGIEELNDAMKNGNVLSAKVLPYVAEISKRMAAGGIDEARKASFAEENRFKNQATSGWKNFREGGGESGVAFFWQMMQRMGQWWIDNGSSLGSAFETAVYWLDAVRLGAYELASFVRTGENNSFVEWASEWGINLQEFRNEILKSLKSLTIIGDMFGLNGQVDLKTRIQNFGVRIQEILQEVNVVLEGIAQFLIAARQLKQRKWYEAYAVLNPFSEVSKEQRASVGGLWQAVKGVFGATISAAGVVTDQVNVTNPNKTEYQVYGDGKGGFTPRTDPYKTWADGMTFNPTKSEDSKQLTITKPNPVITNVLPPPTVIKQPELLQKQTTPSTYIPVVKPLVMPQTFIKPEYPVATPVINRVMEASKNYSATSNISNTVNNTVNKMQPTSLPSYAGGVMNQTAQQQVQTINQNVNVKLDVQGNAAAITALIDDRTRTQLPILLSSMITKEITAAPVSR